MRSDNEVLRQISNSKNLVGWISPLGEIMIVDAYRHLKKLAKKIELVATALAVLQEELNQAADEHVAHLSDYDHPEWHTYEIWADSHSRDVQQDIYDKLYKLGWVRFGLYFSTASGTIAFQFDERFQDRYTEGLKALSELTGKKMDLLSIAIEA